MASILGDAPPEFGDPAEEVKMPCRTRTAVHETALRVARQVVDAVAGRMQNMALDRVCVGAPELHRLP
eukprot:3788945-Prorocentrum_lima.AAC.1